MPYPLAVVLFDGAGLAAMGLRQAGFRTIGIELNPIAHRLGLAILEAEIEEYGADSPAAQSQVMLGDVRDPAVADLMKMADVIWASPPCQRHSSARTQGEATSGFAEDLLPWSLSLPDAYPDKKAVWVENVTKMTKGSNDWGTLYNAYQFGTAQCRNRVIGGRYPEPNTLWPYKKAPGGVPCITATEWKGCATDKRRASRFYGRRLTIEECAHHMDLPMWAVQAMRQAWTSAFTLIGWDREIYKAIGNGVPLKMARAFGAAAR